MKKTFKKRAFISAIAMLVVSAIVLTSATFAWFSMSKQATIDQMNLSVTAPEGIQISANAKAWTSRLIPAYLFPRTDEERNDRYAAYEGNDNMMPTDLKPVSAAFRFATNDITDFFSGSTDADRVITMEKLTQKTANEDLNGFVAFDIFLKVATTQTVSLSKINFEDTTGADALTALRVGFQVMGNVKADATQAQAIGLKQFNTSSNTLFVYEVDSNNRSVDAIASGHSNGWVATQPVSSRGQVSVDPTDYVVKDRNYIETGGYFCRLIKDTDPVGTFTILDGITKIRVYVWMEGQDIDCRNSIAGSIITGNIQFSIN